LKSNFSRSATSAIQVHSCRHRVPLGNGMKLVLDKQKTGGRRKSRLQERFDKLCKSLERERRRNTRFRHDLDELVEIFHRRSLENDETVFDDLVALSEKLIAFAARKSLSDWHRRELDEWLRELIDRRISRLEPKIAEQLRLDYREAIARAMGIPVDDLDEILEPEGEGMRQGFGEHDSTQPADEMDEGPWQEDLFGFDDIDPEVEPFDGNAEADGPGRIDDEEAAHVGQKVMDGSWAKDLFRRAAQALHPDREPDPERRQVKQERMAQLLRARKHGDIMTMLTIYSESVSGADIVLAEQEMIEICDVLEDQVEALELEKFEYVYSNPARHLVFDLFYHGTKKGRKRRLQEWERDLKHETADLRGLITFLRNLTCLKSVLEDRRDQRAAMIADAMFDTVPF